jgi:serine/threonine protein kinase
MDRVQQQDRAWDDDRLMSLVDSALAQPPSEREVYLRRECVGDSRLFEQARDDVQWEERMSGFLLEPFCSLDLFDPALEPGELLEGRFRIVREVGEGGMAVVYEAMDEKLGRRIGIKCAKPGFRARLTPEVRHATEISHPNVCKIFEIHTAETDRGEIDFITMEFLDGPTLAERLHQGSLPPNDAAAIANQLCLGLAEAHHNHVIHGDLKSNNIILTHTPDGVRAVITDFGLARRSASQQPTVQSDELGGAPIYMAPELLKGGKPSVASDIYALGVIFHEMACGRQPFNRETSWKEPLTARPAPLAYRWGKVVARCLDPEVARRFRNANEIVQVLAPPRWRRWFAGAAATTAALVVVTGVTTYKWAIAPQEVVRLAILPFKSNAAIGPLSEGMLLDTSDRLSRVKASRNQRVTVIPLIDALHNKVDQPAKARTMLGATYALHGTLRSEGGRIFVVAYVTDTNSLVQLTEWRGQYSTEELRSMPVALAGMVTRTLKFPPLAQVSTVNAAAYVDYSAGLALARQEAKLDRALELLGRAVSADSNSPLTHAGLAEVQWLKYISTKDPQWEQRALASLQNAEERNPDVAALRVLSGTIHDYYGQYGQAEADLSRALELEPNNGDAWRQLGKVYEDNNQPNQALAAYLKAIAIQPQYFKNYQRLGAFYFVGGDYDNAVRQYKEMVRLAPNLADAHYALAAPYLNMGRYAEAEYELNVAISIHETANAVLGLGLSRFYQGRDREAIPYFQRAIEIGPPTSLFYINLGSVLRRASFLREAKEAYGKGLDLADAELAKNPKNGYEKACLAYLCARLGDVRRADSEAAQALQISGGAVNVRWMVALTYEALGQRDKTLATVQGAPASILDRLSRFPDVAELHADPRFQNELLSRQIH